jgi:hypothetical protein
MILAKLALLIRVMTLYIRGEYYEHYERELDQTLWNERTGRHLWRKYKNLAHMDTKTPGCHRR